MMRRRDFFRAALGLPVVALGAKQVEAREPKVHTITDTAHRASWTASNWKNGAIAVHSGTYTLSSGVTHVFGPSKVWVE